MTPQHLAEPAQLSGRSAICRELVSNELVYGEQDKKIFCISVDNSMQWMHGAKYDRTEPVYGVDRPRKPSGIPAGCRPESRFRPDDLRTG